MSKALHKITIIDDHRIFADGLHVMLAHMEPNYELTTLYNVDLNHVDDLVNADLLLIDLHMPNLSGLNLMQALIQRKFDVKVLVISGSDDINDVEHALRLGAKGFIPKSLPSEEMAVAIKQVLQGDIYLPIHLERSVNWSACNPNLDASNGHQTNVDGLRPRQLEVLELIHQGCPNIKIATILGISESAVKSHISILFKALKVKNRTSAVKRAQEVGLLNQD